MTHSASWEISPEHCRYTQASFFQCSVNKLTGFSLVSQREKIREKFVAALKEEFAGKGLRFTKGERTESPFPPFITIHIPKRRRNFK